MTLAVAALSVPLPASATPQLNAVEKAGAATGLPRDGVPIGPSAGGPSRSCHYYGTCPTGPRHKKKHKRHRPQEHGGRPEGEAAPSGPGARPAGPAQTGGGNPRQTGPTGTQNGGPISNNQSSGPIGNNHGSGPLTGITGPITDNIVPVKEDRPTETSSTHAVATPTVTVTPAVTPTVTVTVDPSAPAVAPSAAPVLTVPGPVPPVDTPPAEEVVTDTATTGDPGLLAAPSGLGLGLGLGIGLGLDLSALLGGGCDRTLACTPSTSVPPPPPVTEAAPAARPCAVTRSTSGCLPALGTSLGTVGTLVSGLRAPCRITAAPVATRTTVRPQACAPSQEIMPYLWPRTAGAGQANPRIP